MSEKKSSARQRQERLRAALRANLKRRKAQARRRAMLTAAARDAAARNGNDESSGA